MNLINLIYVFIYCTIGLYSSTIAYSYFDWPGAIIGFIAGFIISDLVTIISTKVISSLFPHDTPHCKCGLSYKEGHFEPWKDNVFIDVCPCGKKYVFKDNYTKFMEVDCNNNIHPYLIKKGKKWILNTINKDNKDT